MYDRVIVILFDYLMSFGKKVCSEVCNCAIKTLRHNQPSVFEMLKPLDL